MSLFGFVKKREKKNQSTSLANCHIFSNHKADFGIVCEDKIFGESIHLK
jgi:hypothetical protein